MGKNMFNYMQQKWKWSSVASEIAITRYDPKSTYRLECLDYYQ